MNNLIHHPRSAYLTLLIIAISFALLSSLTACRSTTPATQFTTALPTSLGEQNIEEKSKTPTPIPTITKTITLTKTPIKTKKYQWTSTPKPSATITPTKAPLTTYYDKEFGIHISYPNNWVNTANRTFIGEDGYLILYKVEKYHSPEWGHVAMDIANTLYSKYHPHLYCLGGWEHGCAISMVGPDPSGKMVVIDVGVFPYHKTQYSTDFFIIETTRFHSDNIVDSIIWDENLVLPTPTESPAGTPNPIKTEYPEGISIEELTYNSPEYKKEDRSKPDTYVGTSTNCGLGNDPKNQKFHSSNVDYNWITVQRDNQTVYEFASWVFNEPFPWSFCTSGDFWMVESHGFTVINGQILNHALGFDEVFGWHVLSGKPVYFVKQDNKYQISYNGKLLPVKYDNIGHYYCCGYSGDNPRTDGMNTWFYAWRDGVEYLVVLRTK